jgi:hypothetical protein
MGLLAALTLAVPGFVQVRACDDIEPLRWKTFLYETEAPGLLTQETFVPETAWADDPADVTGGQVVRRCFGEATPHSRRVVVHRYPPAPFTPTRVRPVVLVGGAGDNALRGLSFMAVSLSRAGFTTYAVTFAHNQGDNFQQAEQVSHVVALALEETGAQRADVVAYSKGVMAARIYLSHLSADDFAGTHDPYATRGTRYRGDVGRFISIGGANAGQDILFRWSASNLIAGGVWGEKFNAPTSWSTYFPQTSAAPLTAQDWSARVITGDAFVGQAQLLADLRPMHTLPGQNPALGAYSTSQVDYLTTYDGGLGFMSRSPGIRAGMERGGGAIARLQQVGVDPGVELHLVAGGNPILSVGGLNAGLLESGWGDLNAAERRAQWEGLVGQWVEQTFPWFEAFSADVPRLLAGTAFLGEISGPSDGLVFVASALDDSGLTARGARVFGRQTFEALNHSELVAAGHLAATFYGDRELAGGYYDADLAAKYDEPANQSVEWVIEVLSRAVPEAPPAQDAGATPEGALADAELPPPGPESVADPDGGDAGDARFADGSVASDVQGEASDPTLGADSGPKRPSTGRRFGGSCGQAPASPVGAAWIGAAIGLGAALMKNRRRRR